MWRRLTLVAFVCLSPAPLIAGAPCPSAPSGIVWSLEGGWLAAGAPVSVLDGVADIGALRPASTTSASRIVVLQNRGAIVTRVCPPRAPCNNECHPARPGAAEMGVVQFTAIRHEAGQPRYKVAMSRSSGWTDAIVAINADGSLDLADVFRGSRARSIRYRWCPTDVAVACDSAYATVNWDGQAARVASHAPRAGLFRIVEDDGIADAWVRLVPAERAATVKAEYLAAISAIKTWALPESETPLPSLDRLWRMALASVGDAR